MIKLYHGTSTVLLPDILRDGIQPRKVTNKSNWSGDIASKDGFVYLTTAYAIYFAGAATMKHGGDLAIIELEVEDSALYPDEDFIAHALKATSPKHRRMKLETIIKGIQLSLYKHHWKQSLQHNGNVAIRAVAPENIRRHAIIPRTEGSVILASGADSMPIPLNYKFMGGYYRKCMEAVISGGVDGLKAFLIEMQKNRIAMFSGIETGH